MLEGACGVAFSLLAVILDAEAPMKAGAAPGCTSGDCVVRGRRAMVAGRGVVFAAVDLGIWGTGGTLLACGVFGVLLLLRPRSLSMVRGG